MEWEWSPTPSTKIDISPARTTGVITIDKTNHSTLQSTLINDSWDILNYPFCYERPIEGIINIPNKLLQDDYIGERWDLMEIIYIALQNNYQFRVAKTLNVPHG